VSIERVEAAAMRRDIDRAEQWAAEPYSDRRHAAQPAPKPTPTSGTTHGTTTTTRGPTWSVASPWTPPAGDTYPVTHPSTSDWTVPDDSPLGSLFAGYGGIELALSSVLDVRPAWFVEFDKAPSKVLANHWPDVPNHGDVTKIDWATVEPVDIITGGSPCQDLSHAGKRAGMTEGTRSNLWVQMREAINVIRPRLVAVGERPRRLLSPSR
jgi:hypothetical protein